MSHQSRLAVSTTAITTTAGVSIEMAAARGVAAAAAASLPTGAVTWRSDVSSDVTSLSSVTPRSARDDICDRGQVVLTARQLIAELQEMLRTDCDDGGRRPKSLLHQPAADQERLAISATSSSAGYQPKILTKAAKSASVSHRDSQHDRSRRAELPVDPAAVSCTHHHHHHPQVTRLQTPPPPSVCLDLQACNGLCLVFANFSSFLPTSKEGASIKVNIPDGEDLRHRAGQIRDTASAIGELFNSRLEFTVLIHWNKTRSETLQLLRQSASAMSEGGRDCCFAFFLGRGGPGHFAAACGGRITLTDILATLAVGQRSRLPVFVFGELTAATPASPALEDQQKELQQLQAASTNLKPDLPGDQLLLWMLDAPQVTDMIVQQLARSHQSGGKDVASTVAGVAEWLRRRGKDGEAAAGCRCRFLSRLGRLVYLTVPDCI